MSGLGRDARRLVERARETGGPTPDQRHRVRRALLRHAAAAGVAATAAGTAKAAAATATSAASGAGAGVGALAGWKVGLAVVVVSGTVATGAWMTTRPEPEAPAARSETAPAPPAVDEPGVLPDVSAETPAPPPEPEIAAPEPPSGPAASRIPRVPDEPPLRDPDPVTELEAPSPEALAPQVALLAEAVEAIGAGDPERALALLDRHESLYPASPLARERADARERARAAAARESAP